MSDMNKRIFERMPYAIFILIAATMMAFMLESFFDRRWIWFTIDLVLFVYWTLASYLKYAIKEYPEVKERLLG